MSKTRSESPAYKWALVGMLWFVCFFNYADRQAIFSVFPLLRGELHLSNVQLGLVGSAFMWMYALVGPAAGALCDRFSRKALLLGGLVFWSAVTAATAAMHSYGGLLLCRALGGLGEALYFPASMALIGSYHGPATRSRAMALHQSSVYAGSIAGGAASGYLGQTYGWRSSFLWFGGLGIVLALVLWQLLHEPRNAAAEEHSDVLESAEDALPVVSAAPSQTESFMAGVLDVLRRPAVLLLIAVFTGANFVAVVFLTWMPTYLADRFGMSLLMAGLNGSAYLQVASVLGVLGGGFLADALVQRGGGMMRGGRRLAQSLGLMGGVPFLFLAGHTRAVPVLLLALAGFGLFKGVYDANIWASLYDVIPANRRGSAVGIMNSIGWLGGGTAPVLIALAARRFGMGAAISATACIYLLLGAVLLLAARVAMKRSAAI